MDQMASVACHSNSARLFCSRVPCVGLVSFGTSPQQNHPAWHQFTIPGRIVYIFGLHLKKVEGFKLTIYDGYRIPYIKWHGYEPTDNEITQTMKAVYAHRYPVWLSSYIRDMVKQQREKTYEFLDDLVHVGILAA